MSKLGMPIVVTTVLASTISLKETLAYADTLDNQNTEYELSAPIDFSSVNLDDETLNELLKNNESDDENKINIDQQKATAILNNQEQMLIMPAKIHNADKLTNNLENSKKIVVTQSNSYKSIRINTNKLENSNQNKIANDVQNSTISNVKHPSKQVISVHIVQSNNIKPVNNAQVQTNIRDDSNTNHPNSNITYTSTSINSNHANMQTDDTKNYQPVSKIHKNKRMLEIDISYDNFFGNNFKDSKLTGIDYPLELNEPQKIKERTEPVIALKRKYKTHRIKKISKVQMPPIDYILNAIRKQIDL